MIERRIVRRYATALFHAARNAGVVDSVESDLGLLSYALETSPSFLEAVRSPLLPAGRKHAIVDEIFAGKVNDITLSYLHLLVDKRREDAMPDTQEEYVLLANQARGIITAQVTTAVGMTEQQEALITAKLAEMTGKSVHLEKVLDPEVIGGVLVRIGDTVIDGSIRGKLETLREKLLS